MYGGTRRLEVSLSDPDGITYPIPGNDDAARAIQTYCDLMADAILDGLAAGASNSGIDLGASENPVEPMLAEASAPVAADAAPAGTEGVAAEMEAAAEPAAAEPAAAEPAAETETTSA